MLNYVLYIQIYLCVSYTIFRLLIWFFELKTNYFHNILFYSSCYDGCCVSGCFKGINAFTGIISCYSVTYKRTFTCYGDDMRIIAYMRVSTKSQEKSGLGLDAQREKINIFTDAHDGELIAEYVDVESGSKNERDELKKAIAHAKKIKGTLVIAKLDRISRRVSFIANLMETGINFKVAEMGDATEFQLHIYAALAQEERRLISERTKEALKVAKSQGVELGKNGKVLAANNKRIATSFAETVKDHLLSMRSQGLSFSAIAKELNNRKIQSYYGKKWYGASVQRAYDRLC